MLVLDCPVQTYDWGSTVDIPDFLGWESHGEPVAEVWMGTHPLGQAQARAEDGTRALVDVAGELPFMVKILAAAKPLSIQAHPDASRARQGFVAEDEAGVPLEAAHRVYKDPHPKPEMVYALSTFETLVGFRPTAEILRVLSALEHPLAQHLADQLRDDPGFAGIVRLLERLLADPPTPEVVDELVVACRRATERHIDVRRAYATALLIADHHPGDVGVVVSLLLNRLTLQAGEAAYLEAGIIHAHLSGLALEIMVSSDNVLRAGLTSKHVDPTGLVQILEEGMSRVWRVTPRLRGLSTDVFSPGHGDFALAVAQASAADPDGVALPNKGQRIIVCTGGEVTLVNRAGQSLHLRRGDVVFADASDGRVRVSGTGEVAQGYVPKNATGGRLLGLV